MFSLFREQNWWLPAFESFHFKQPNSSRDSTFKPQGLKFQRSNFLFFFLFRLQAKPEFKCSIEASRHSACLCFIPNYVIPLLVWLLWVSQKSIEEGATIQTRTGTHTLWQDMGHKLRWMGCLGEQYRYQERKKRDRFFLDLQLVLTTNRIFV